jgi:hypothetical protein
MITVEQTEKFANLIEQQLPVDDAVVSGLRKAFPDLHFTYCMDDDVGAAKPVVEREAFNLYLIDGREHCLCLTNDHDVATGLVVAEVIGDED